MATIRLFLDKRAAKENQPAPLKIVITAHQRSVMVSTGVSVLPSQWDADKHIVINSPQKALLNKIIKQKLIDYEAALLRVSANTNIKTLTADEVKKAINNDLYPQEEAVHLFLPYYLQVTDARHGNTHTLFMQTLKHLKGYDSSLDKLKFDDITRDWLLGFVDYMTELGLSQNTRNLHCRHIRAVFNDAIDNELTALYPFRKFKLKDLPTVKRSMTVEQLRTLFEYKGSDYDAYYLDAFKLIFMLIGINVVDLLALKTINSGRIEYYRAKTKRLYSIRVEPEALDIINRHRGNDRLIDYLKDDEHYTLTAHRINYAIKGIGQRLALPFSLSTYWARHSWATIASSLDIPKDTIAAALGHGGNTVTDIYIDFDQKKVDDANRKVLDWVLYGKR